jgi:hypothetical protein
MVSQSWEEKEKNRGKGEKRPGGGGEAEGEGRQGRGGGRGSLLKGRAFSHGNALWLVSISVPMHNKSSVHCHAN